MNDEEWVLVYRYQYWDEESGTMVVSSSFATLDTIKDGLGIPVSETALRVLRNRLDTHGRLLERPTRSASS
jgi:hypothetical protein